MKFEIDTESYVDVFDNANNKIFTVFLDSEHYQFGNLSKHNPLVYGIEIVEKQHLKNIQEGYNNLIKSEDVLL